MLIHSSIKLLSLNQIHISSQNIARPPAPHTPTLITDENHSLKIRWHDEYIFGNTLKNKFINFVFGCVGYVKTPDQRHLKPFEGEKGVSCKDL